MAYRVLTNGEVRTTHSTATDLAASLQAQSLNDAPWYIDFDLPGGFDFKVVELQGDRGQQQTLIIEVDGDCRAYVRSTSEHDGDLGVSWDSECHVKGMRAGFMSINIRFAAHDTNLTDRGLVWVYDNHVNQASARLQFMADGVAEVEHVIAQAEAAIRSQLIEGGLVLA